MTKKTVQQRLDLRVRSATFCFWALVLLVGLGTANLRAEDAPSSTVPPEISAKLKDFLKKLTDAERKRLDGKMDKLVTDVAKTTRLNTEGIKKLRDAAKGAVDAEQAEMTALMAKEFEKVYVANPSEAMGMLDQTEIIDMAATDDLPESEGLTFTHAPDQPAWKNALASTLTPEQAAKWQKFRGAMDDPELAKAINQYLDKTADQNRKRIGSTLLNTCDGTIAELELPKDRADALRALANKAIDASLAVGRKATLESLLRYPEAARSRILNGQGYYYTSPSQNEPENQAVWKTGFAKLLTDEERDRLKNSAETHRARRVRAIGRLMVQMLDKKLALTPEQRGRMQPVAEKLVPAQKAFFPDNENNYFRYDPSLFYKLAKDAKEEDVRPVLDAAQWARWTDLCAHPDADDPENTGRRAVPTPTPTPDQAAPTPPGEPEDLEAAVADYLCKAGEAQHRQFNETMLLQVEEAARVTGMDAKGTTRLRTAALGAAEAMLGTWLYSTESNVRGEVQNATAENIQQKLAGMSRYSYGRQEEDNAVWKAAVRGTLNDEQRQAWQATREERERFTAGTIAEFVTAELDRKLQLSEKQAGRLQPAVVKSLQDYEPEIRSNFSYYTYPWYLQSYLIYIPLHGVPDDELKGILSANQFSTLTSSSEYSNSASYWQNIKSNHDQRVKEKEKGKEKQP